MPNKRIRKKQAKRREKEAEATVRRAHVWVPLNPDSTRDRCIVCGIIEPPYFNNEICPGPRPGWKWKGPTGAVNMSGEPQ